MLDHIKDKWFLEDNSFLFVYVYFTGSTRTRNTYVKNIEIFPKGVMKSNRHTRILSFNNKSRGVRKEHHVLVEKNMFQISKYEFSTTWNVETRVLSIMQHITFLDF